MTGEWIDVDDKMPEDGQECLVTDGVDVELWLYTLEEEQPWQSSTGGPEFYPSSITHWMPLPDPPK